MHVRILRLPIGLAVAVAVMAAGGCVSLATLGDGRTTTMGAIGVSTRDTLTPSPVTYQRSLRYRPVDLCEYDFTETSALSQAPSYAAGLRVNIRPVDNLLFLRATTTLNGVTEDSTAILGEDGKLHRFNFVNLSMGRRVTSENFAEEGEAALRRLGYDDAPDANYLNIFSLFTPHYQGAPLRAGRRVADVFDETGGIWGSYIYSGVSTYSGREVLVLDLVRTMDSLPSLGPVVVGFTLIDPDNMLPVLTTVDFGRHGSQLRLQRRQCGG